MTYVSANAATLDRAYVGRLTGTGVANSPSSLSSVKWEVSPPGRYRVELLPPTTETETISYRYHYLPPPMTASSDVPDFPEEHHMGIVWGVCANNLAGRGKDPGFFYGKYQACLALLRSDNLTAKHENHVTQYEVSQPGQWRTFLPRDLDLGR